MQIQITIDTNNDSPAMVGAIMRAIGVPQPGIVVPNPADAVIKATLAEAERVAAREALQEAAESAPAAPATPTPSAPSAPVEQAEAARRGRGRPRKIVNEANAEPAVPIAPADQSAPTAAVASDATPPAGAAGEASQSFVPPLGPSFNPDGTPTGTVGVIDAPATVEGLLEKVFNRDGPAAAIACLQRFGVMRLRELKDDQKEPFSAYCRDVLAGRENPLGGGEAQ